jgi:hypothetical protein
MKIFGVDFTSVPSSKKAITCVQCRLDEKILYLESSVSIRSFDEFENFIQLPGSWVAGMDFPFGQPRKLIENMGWPQTWEGYIRQLSPLTKQDFDALLKTYRNARPSGDKQHLRQTDEIANSKSPMMMYGVPVGKMFLEGSRRLLDAGVSVYPCRERSDPRIVVEAYPALVARRWIETRSYKSDEKKKQTPALQSAREEVVRGLCSKNTKIYFGFDVYFSSDTAYDFISDNTGDQLDALLCAIQAGWAYTQREHNYGIPTDCDRLEGWIVDPGMEITNSIVM